MGRRISVDCDDLLRIDSRFAEQASEMNQIQEELTAQFNNINQYWQGIDAQNFIMNSNKMTRVLKKERRHLTKWSDYLGRASKRYMGNLRDGLTDMRKNSR